MTSRPSLRADSLLIGMTVMLVMTVVQRAIGFLRGIWFCRFLDDSSLGQWAMAFGFICSVTPMFLLGLPGSLPRFAEQFRLQGRLGLLVRKLTLATAGIALTFVVVAYLVPHQLATLVFGDATVQGMVAGLSLAVLSTIFFNTVHQLVTGLRLVRLGSLMQFLQSVLFTVASVLWLYFGGGMAGVISLYGVTTLLASVPALFGLARSWKSFQTPQVTAVSAPFWKKLLPYAFALWVMNLLANVFELTDRYMLLHWNASGPEIGQRLVGQYHSSLIIPSLIVSVASLVAGVIMPYLVADWEQGRRRRVGERLRRMLVGATLAFTATGILAILFGEWIYEDLLQGRYSDGLGVLPLVLVFSIWSALAAIAQNYLWVSDQGRRVGYALAIGVTSNFILNTILIPRVGLQGAVVGTCISHGVVLLGILGANLRSGMRCDHALLWVMLLPASLLAGPTLAILSLLGVAMTSSHCRRYFGELIDSVRGQLRGLAK